MAHINIHNSYSQLVGFSPEAMKSVVRSLTYKDEDVARQKLGIFLAMKRAAAYKKSRYIAILKDQLKELGPEEVCMIDKDGIFPTGLIHLVEECIKGLPYKQYDARERPEPKIAYRWKKCPADMRYYQAEALEIAKNKGRGVFEMSVGSGKTLLATYLIKDLGVQTLFVVPSSALLTQAYDVFESAFGKSNVMKLDTKVVKNGGKLKNIRVVTIQTLASLHKQGLLEKAVEGVDLFIGDEIHHAGSNSYTRLLPTLKHIYYRFGLSGTYLRNDSKTFQLWGVAGQKLYEYGASKATKEGFLTPVEFRITKLAGSPSRDYQSEYKSNYSSLELMQAILSTIRGIGKNKQVLILVDRKDAVGGILHKFLEQHNIAARYVTGDNSKAEVKAAIEDFNSKKERILIGSTVFSEGVDIQSTDALIMCRGGKSEIAITQSIGRAIRLYPGKTLATVYDYNFRYTKYLCKHLALRHEIYEKQFSGTVTYA